jgi:S-adenosylmethionine synthetase
MKNFLKYILESNDTAANEDIAPLDETEALNILIDDEVLKNA